MSEVVICEPIRTPVGRFGGVFASLSATDLAVSAMSSLVQRTGLAEGDVDDVVLGQCNPSGEAPAIGRVAAIDAGLGTSVPGLQIDRRCGSGLQAVLYAAMQVGSGAARLVVAGGVESMSQAEHYVLGLRRGVRGDGVELMDRLARARVTAGASADDLERLLLVAHASMLSRRRSRGLRTPSDPQTVALPPEPAPA